MRTLNHRVKVFLLVAVLLPLYGYCSTDSTPPVVSLESLVKQNDSLSWTERTFFFKGRIIGLDQNVYTALPYEAIKIKLQAYWADQDLDFQTDTVIIINTDHNLTTDSTYLLILRLESGLLKTQNGTNLYRIYEGQIKSLGKARIPENPETPKRTKEERKNQLVLWLIVSLALNFFAVLLIVLLKRDRQ